MMIRKFLLTSATALALMGCRGGETGTSASTPAAEGATLSIDYEKFTLDNGLDVVLQVDRSDPIVAVTTVIHAGSNREKPGRTGFAHFFEHMAFNDSENVPRGWNRKAIPEWGGQRNGGTWSDGTIYFEVVPKDAFDKILWIDSDRLGYMINTVTTAALEREKQVVKNEKRQRVDNAAYGYTNEVIRKALYPEGHPYSWTVIGSLPDLQAATLEDLREFHSDWYGPNNVTLSIVGDIDIAETKKKVELWFGEIPRGKDVEKPAPQPVQLDAIKNLWFEDSFAKLPELRLTFPTVESLHADEQALNLLAQILGGSRNAPLYSVIVEEQELAPNVSAFHRASQMAGEFTIRVRANPGTDLDDVHAHVLAAMAQLQSGGVDATDLKRIKAEQETIIYNQLSTVLGKSRNLAQNNEFAGDPAWSVKVAEAVQAVTDTEIMAAYDKYIKDKPYILTSFVPKGQADLAVDGAERASVWIEEVKANVASEEVSAGEVAEFEKTPTVHDRSEPPFGELPRFTMPDIWTRTLPNGVVIRGVQTDEVPLVNVRLTFSGGAWSETPDQAGRMVMLSALMNEGTENRSPAEFEQAVGLLGSSISVNAGTETTTLSANSLSRNFDATAELMAEVLSAPRFEDAIFKQVKSAQLTAIKGREANARVVGNLAFSQLLYGNDHPMGRPFRGDAATASALGLSDLKTAHQALLNAKAHIQIVGDIDPDAAVAALSKVVDQLSPNGEAYPDYPITPKTSPGKVYFIDIAGAKQSALTIGKLTLATGDPEFNQLRMANEKLGGGISGDLSQTLRIEKGYTYGAFSSIPNGSVKRPFTIGTAVRANATKASLETIREMLLAYGPDFDQAAVEKTQQKVIKDNTRSFESAGAKLGLLGNIAQYGLSDKYIEERQAELLQMDVAKFQNLIDQHLQEDDMIYLIVGDKATQFGPVSEFAKATGKGEVVELDIYGQVLK